MNQINDIKNKIREYDDNQTALFAKRKLDYVYPEVDYSTSTTNLDVEDSLSVPRHTLRQAEEQQSSWSLSNVGKIFPDYFDIAKNSIKLFGKRWIGQNIDGDFAKQYDISRDNHDLEEVELYVNSQNLLKTLLSKLRDAERIGDIYSILSINSQINDLENEIKRLDYYFTHEGKNHPVVTEMMYDESKFGAGDFISSLGQYTRQGYRNIEADVKQDPYSANTLLAPLKAAGATLLGTANSIAAELSSFVSNITDPSEYKKNAVNRYIQNLDPNNEGDAYILNKFYKGSALNVNSIGSSIDRKKLDSWKKYNKDKEEELAVDFELDFDDAKNASKVPLDFEKEQEEFMGQPAWKLALSPLQTALYGIPELASTIGLFKYQAGAMAFDRIMVAGLSFLSKKFPMALRAAGPVGVINVGVGFAAAEMSREEETALEKILGIYQRVIQNTKDTSNYKRILDVTKDYLSTLGYDPEILDEELLIKAAISYNIPTGDPYFEAEKRNAQKGIDVLVNANNALAIHDYIQSFPWMSYSGRAMDKFFNGAFNAIKDTKFAKVLTTAKNHTVGKVADRFLSKDAPKGLLYRKDIAKWLAKREAVLLGEGITEGGEEIVQEVLLSRYQRGLYDDINTQPSMLGVDASIWAADLVLEAIPDYLGIHPWDPELPTKDIQKAFNIGLVSSMEFSGLLRSASNVYTGENGNIRELYQKLKSDNAVSKLISNYYNLVQDQQHLDFFYESLKKHGVSYQNLIDALNNLKGNKLDQFKEFNDESIDNDIQMLTNLYFAINNKDFDEFFKEAGIKKWDDRHKIYAINAAKALTDVEKSRETEMNKLKKLSEIEDDREYAANRILDLLDDVNSEIEDGIAGTVASTSASLYDILKKKYPKLVQMINYFSKLFDKYAQSKKGDRKLKILLKITELKLGGIDAFLLNADIQEYLSDLYGDEYDAVSVFEDKSIVANKNKKNAYTLAAERALDNEYTQQFDTTDKDDEESKKKNASAFILFINDPYIREAGLRRGYSIMSLDSHLSLIFKDNDKKSAIIGEAQALTNDELLNRRNFILGNIKLYQDATQTARTKYNLDVNEKTDQLLSEVLQITGLDLDTRRLRGIKQQLKDLLKKLEEKEAQLLKLTDLKTLFDYFKDVPVLFDDQREYDRLYGEYSLINAIRGVQNIIASAYIGGQSDPNELETALYDGIVDNPLSKISLSYRKRMAENSPLADRDVTEDYDALKNHDLTDLRKKAAWTIVKDQLHDTEIRRKIANRRWEQELPLTPGELLQMDEAEEKETARIGLINSSDEKSPNRQPTDAEKRLKEKLFNSREKSELEKDKIAAELAEVAKRRQEQEDADKETKEETPKEGKLPKIEETPKIEEQPRLEEQPSEKLPIIDELQARNPEGIDIILSLSNPDQIIQPENLIWDGENLYIKNGENIDQIDEANVAEILLELDLQRLITPVSIDDIPNNKLSNSEQRAQMSKDDISTLISNVFFYRPTALIDKETGKVVIPQMVVGKKQLQFRKPVAPGSELAKKLVQPGWLLSTTKYYVVSDPLDRHDKKTTDASDEDMLTVAMAIEDDTNTYLVFLRALSKTWNKGEKQIFIDKKENDPFYRVMMHGIDMSFIENVLNLPVGTITLNQNLSIEEKFAYYQLAINSQVVYELGEQYDRAKQQGIVNISKKKYISDNYVQMEDMIRKRNAKFGKKIFTRQQAYDEVEKLRNFRNAIISAYTSKKDGKIVVPDTVRTDVVPCGVGQTNGKFDNQKDGENPLYRSIAETNDVELIQRQLLSGDMAIGFGMGRFANRDNRWTIWDVFNPQTKIFNGKGLSGKLYWFVKSLTDGKLPVPIMLAEELFNTQEVVVNGERLVNRIGKTTKRGPVLCLEKDPTGKNWVNTNKDGYLPSAAEVLFLLLTRQIDLGVSPDIYGQIVDLFIHTGEKTLLLNQPKLLNNPLLPFIEKQLFFGVRENSKDDVNKLYIYLPGSGNTAKGYTVDELQDPTLKALVIKAIASQFHWNTDVDFMSQALKINYMDNSALSLLIQWMIKQHDGNITEDTLLSLLGCPQLSFRIGDFVNVGKNGKIKAKDNVSYLAWMIKNLKIKTDVSKQIFKDPFVYGSGVEVLNNNEHVDEFAEQLGQGELNIIEISESVIHKELGGVTQLPFGEDLTKAMDLLSESSISKKNGGTSAVYIIRGYNNDSNLKADKVIPTAINKIQEALTAHNKKYNTKYSTEGFKLRPNAERMIKDVWSNGLGFIRVELFNNGQFNVVVKQNNDILNAEMTVSGVFETRGGSATVDLEQERRWICETLGIDEGNVLVTNGIMKSVDDRIVYGVTNVALDKLEKTLSGFFMLSKYGDEGLGYHEAWHYINLLVHDKQTRMRMYKAYLATHKKLDMPGIKYRDVEEAMADEFARDILLDRDTSVSGLLRRCFRNILDFVLFTGNRKAYREVFNKIKSSGYSGAKLDLESVKEFQKAYENGVYATTEIPEVPTKITKNLKYISHYYLLLDGADAIANKIMQSIPFATKKQINEWNKDDKVFLILDLVQEIIDELVDLDKINILNDLLDNPRLIQNTVRKKFRSFGFSVLIESKKADKDIDVKKVDKKEENSSALGKEENPENTWDKFVLESRRKDNVSNDIKFFLSKIPVWKKVWKEDGTYSYIIDRDDFMIPRQYDFDEALKKLHQDLWWILSFGRLEENPKSNYTYHKHSLMGAIERRKDSQEFYYSLWTYLNQYFNQSTSEETLVRSGLFNAINSSKQHIDVLNISDFTYDDKKRFSKNIQLEDLNIINQSLDEYAGSINLDTSDKIVADKDRNFEFLADEYQDVIRNLTSDWSKNLASSGFVMYNKKSGKTLQNAAFTNSIYSQFYTLKKEIEKQNKSSKKLKINSIKEDFIKLLNNIGIDCDTSSFNIFLYSMSGVSGRDLTGKELIQTLNNIVSSDDPGSIGYIINELAGKIKNRRKYNKELDEMFKYFPEDSQISKLAIAWDAAYPTKFEFSVKDAVGNRLYPINLNNHISDRTTWMNDPNNPFLDDLLESTYSRHSILAGCGRLVDEDDPTTKIQLRTFVGIKDGDTNDGGDYLLITDQEDYIAKLYMTINSRIILPTMADKKTWYSIYSKYLENAMSHSVTIVTPDVGAINQEIYNVYQKINPFNKNDKRWGSLEKKWKAEAHKWFGSLDRNSQEYQQIQLAGVRAIQENSSKEILYSIKDGKIVPRFENKILRTFSLYFLDEIESLIGYYSKEHVKEMVENARFSVDNFSGTVDSKTGRLNCDGHGGFFRYFYDILKTVDTKSSLSKDGEPVINLNHHIQALYELQKRIMDSKVTNSSSDQESSFQNIRKSLLGDSDELDGFELIREFLKDLKAQTFVKEEMASDELLELINDKLIDLTYHELLEISSESGSLKLAQFDKDLGLYLPTAIPSLFLKPYIEVYKKAGLGGSTDNVYKKTPYDILANALFSLISNHVVNCAISVIETEKVYTGDPAFFKHKINDNDPKDTVTLQYVFDKDNTVEDFSVNVINFYDTFADKIKRLGGVLSPGSEIRPDYTDLEIARDPSLAFTKYTNLAMEDINVPSLFIDELTDRFKKQLIVDQIRTGYNNIIDKVRKYIIKDIKKENVELSDEDVIDNIYAKEKYSEYAYNALPETARTEVDKLLDEQINPYLIVKEVSNAQVFIRPELYRKIRIGLGMWKFEEDEDGYSDEAAFNIIQRGDGTEWMKDPNVLKIVKKFQLFPLKMSYYQNDIILATKEYSYMKPIYNKMAIFPLFKFTRSTDTGDMLYKRMNREGNEIDMITFKSAIKTGAPQNGAIPSTVSKENAIQQLKKEHKGDPNYKPSMKEIIEKMDIEGALSSIDESFQYNSNFHIDYKTGRVLSNNSDSNTLNVEILDLRNLRMQLNTLAHEDDIRAIGTQMFKIAFSNIIENARYGTNKKGRLSRRGSTIKKSIMSCIFALTQLGIFGINSEFYSEGRVDDKKVLNFVELIIDINDLGDVAKSIIGNGACAESLINRTVFENSSSAHVNKKVVDINTKGGSAIQQSVFGFVGMNSSNIGVQYNGGKELKWSTEEGSMEVLLSMNFFKSVLPAELLSAGFDKQRQWLIDHDVIKGRKTGKMGFTDEDLSIKKVLDEFVPEDRILYSDWSDETFKYLDDIGASRKYGGTVYSIILKARIDTPENVKKELDQFLKSKGVSFDTKYPKQNTMEGEMSNPKPFGIGYRIPTQGMSSMFSFIVADVLPSQCGDLIIVPREFVAQTGSDFDVDKIYVAFRSYKDGKLETISDDDIKKINNAHKAEDISELINSGGAIANKLLDDYTDIITDTKNYADSRASIDVLTKNIHTDFLNRVGIKRRGYISGMTELLPSFLALKKKEFTVGKNGISPFALNITHLALTLYTHLTIDFGIVGKRYGLNPLDRIYGKDKLRISGWLSAMVNAHVDVAKDPYIFELNLNKATYNHANLLIRTGQGMSTFTFLAQPILKLYANTLNNAGGIYGDNIDGLVFYNPSASAKKTKIMKSIMKQYLQQLIELANLYELNEEYKDYIEYFDYKSMPGKDLSRYLEKNKTAPRSPKLFDRSLVLNSEYGIQSINNYITNVDNITSENVSDHLDSIVYLLYSILAFDEMDEYAQDLSKLVQMSRIDTKKFGKTYYEKLDFENLFTVFLNSSSSFTINNSKIYNSITKDLVKKDDNLYDPVDVSRAALRYYYNSTFLMKKFYWANRLSRGIMEKQLLSANPNFNDVLKNIFINVFGAQEDVLDENGKEIKCFKPAYNKKSIEAVAKTANDIARFNAFFTFGYNIYKQEMSKTKGNTNMIDFTEGGDIQAVITRYSKLLYGNDKEESIFVRLRKLMRNIKEETDPKKYFGLGYNGQIKNHLLNYLSPLTPTKQYPIGRMLLKNSQTDNNNIQEVYLGAAFSQLLGHKNPEVSKLANDLAFYAYYSGFDKNSAGSFFHLVPVSYRQQYDKAIKKTLMLLNSSNSVDVYKGLCAIGAVKDAAKESLDSVKDKAAKNILSTIGRNYWFNSDIVQVHSLPKSFAVDRFLSYSRNINIEKGEAEEFVGKLVVQKELKAIAYQYIAIASKKSYPEYLKLKSGILYRKIGVVKRSATSKKTGKVYNASSYYIYIPAQKAGFKNSKLQLFELFCGRFNLSIYPQLQFDESFSENVVREEIEKIIKNNKGYYDLQVIWDTQCVEDIYKSTNSSMYANYRGLIESNVSGWQNGRIVPTQNIGLADYIGCRDADVILNFTIIKYNDNRSVIEKFKDKVVNIPLDQGNISSIIKKIKDLIADKPVKIHITSPVTSNAEWRQSVITDDMLDSYVSDYMDWFKSAVEGNPDALALISNKEKDVRSDNGHLNTIVRQYLGSKLDNVVRRLINDNVSIENITSQMTHSNNLIASAVDTACENNKEDLPLHPGILYVPKSYGMYLAQDITRLSVTDGKSTDDVKTEIKLYKKSKNTAKIEKVVDLIESEQKLEEEDNKKPVSKLVEQVEKSNDKTHENCGTGTKQGKKSRFSMSASDIVDAVTNNKE